MTKEIQVTSTNHLTILTTGGGSVATPRDLRVLLNVCAARSL